MSEINLSIVAACLERAAELTESPNLLPVCEALRHAAAELMQIQSEDYGEPVPRNIDEARARFGQLRK